VAVLEPPQAAQADRPRRPDHDHVAAQIVARLIELPRRAVVLAEDETHLNLLPHLAGPAPADPLLLPQPSPGQMLATAAPRTSPWLSPG
jgi:hypothetical protein